MRTNTIIICENAAIAAQPFDGRKTTVLAIKRRSAEEEEQPGRLRLRPQSAG